jgi:hypothetical protein
MLDFRSAAANSMTWTRRPLPLLMILLGALGCATHHRKDLQLVSKRLDSNTILIQVCNRQETDVIRVPRFSRKELSQLPVSESGDTIVVTWFPQRYRDVIVFPGRESYDTVAVDSCLDVMLIDGDNRNVQYVSCRNLFFHRSRILLPVSGTVMYKIPPDDDVFIGGFARP